MATEFVNKRRVCGCTVEGFGPDAYRDYDYEILCPVCGNWSADYGEVSENENADGSRQLWLCGPCARKAIREWEEERRYGDEPSRSR